MSLLLLNDNVDEETFPNDIFQIAKVQNLANCSLALRIKGLLIKRRVKHLSHFRMLFNSPVN